MAKIRNKWHEPVAIKVGPFTALLADPDEVAEVPDEVAQSIFADGREDLYWTPVDAAATAAPEPAA